MAFELPSLPYADTALEPHYSAKTFSFHHGKHHKAYVDNLNKLLPGLALRAQQPGRDHQGHRRRREQGRLLQQRRAGVEPHLLLALHGAGRRQQADR